MCQGECCGCSASGRLGQLQGIQGLGKYLSAFLIYSEYRHRHKCARGHNKTLGHSHIPSSPNEMSEPTLMAVSSQLYDLTKTFSMRDGETNRLKENTKLTNEHGGKLTHSL